MNYEKEIKKIFSEIFEISAENIDPKIKQNELKSWDSLGQLRLIMALEENFEIAFDIEEIASLNSFDKILNKTSQKISERKL